MTCALWLWIVEDSCPICLNTLAAAIAEEEMVIANDTPVSPDSLGVVRLSTCSHHFCRKWCVRLLVRGLIVLIAARSISRWAREGVSCFDMLFLRYAIPERECDRSCALRICDALLAERHYSEPRNRRSWTRSRK